MLTVNTIPWLNCTDLRICHFSLLWYGIDAALTSAVALFNCNCILASESIF